MTRSSATAAARGLAAAAVLACAAGLAAACGTSSPGVASPGPSPTSTSKPSVNPGGTIAATTPPATPTTSATPPCATSSLKVTVATSGGGAAAGSTYYPLDFVNVSGTSCTLYGYPGVSFVSAQGGSQIGPAANRNPAMPKTLVTVAPGQTVHAELQVADAQNYPPGDCGIVTAHWLKVYPPNQTAPVYVSFSAQACSKAKQILTVQTVQTGTSGA